MDQFKFDFNNYLKTVQPTYVRFIVIGLVTLGFMVFMEVGFYGQFTTMQIEQCSGLSGLNNGTGNSNSYSLDNCFNDGVPQCLNDYFNTDSKYNLSFGVSLFGLQGDEYSGFILLVSFICFMLEVCLYLALDYLLYLKRKRIQNILSSTKVFIEGEKKHEVRLTIFLLINVFIFMALKLVWIYWRNHQYGELPCNGDTIHLVFGITMTSSISLIVQYFLTYVFFPLMYFIAYVNTLAELDFKNMITHLSYSSVKQFKNITTFDMSKYQELIDRVIQEKYSNCNFLTRFFKSHTFTFTSTSDDEISDILLHHKSICPSDFKIMLHCEGNNNTITDISTSLINSNEDNDDGSYKNNINNVDDGRSDNFNNNLTYQSSTPNEKTKLLN